MSFECRFCGRGDLYRVRRRALDVPLSTFGLFPYRCDACSKRSYRFSSRRTREHGPIERDVELAAGPRGHEEPLRDAPLLVQLLQHLAVGHTPRTRPNHRRRRR